MFIADEETIPDTKQHDDDSDDIASTKGKRTATVASLDDCLSFSLDSSSINGIFFTKYTFFSCVGLTVLIFLSNNNNNILNNRFQVFPSELFDANQFEFYQIFYIQTSIAKL